MAPSIEPLGKCSVSHGKLLGLRRSILMTTRRVSLAVAALFLVLTFRPLAQEQAVPADLKPLLAAPQSEMRMVVQRYTLDRQTLSGNYANGAARGGRGGRGRGADAAAMPAPPPLVPMSPARIARLKRFDTNWQAALARIDAAKLTGAARADLDTLKSSVERQPRTARCRDPDDEAGARGGAIRAQARAARRSAHPRRRHGLAASCRRPDRCHQGDCEALGRGTARES